MQRQWKRILSGRVSIQDFVFAKEVRLGTYRTRGPSSLPPAAIVATKAMRIDPRAEPRYAERVPYVVIYREPGARLADMVVDPMDLLAVDSPHRLNSLYYINKQIIPALQRAFGLVGGNLNQWFLEMPRPVREVFFKQPLSAANPNRTRIDYYYLSRHCILCGELVQTLSNLCNQCLQNEAAATTAIIRKTSKLESEMQHLTAVSTIAILFRYIRFLGFFGYTNLLSTESDALVACCLIYSIGSVITKVLLTFISDSFFRKICKNHPYNITKRKM